MSLAVQMVDEEEHVRNKKKAYSFGKFLRRNLKSPKRMGPKSFDKFMRSLKEIDDDRPLSSYGVG